MTQRVELSAIQEAVMQYLAAGHTWSDLCKSIDWMQSPTKPESSRLQRALGLRPEGHRIRKTDYTNKKLNVKTAIAVVRAIGRSPNEFDL